ncbi:transcription termination factor 4, mitochondrial [Trematomus bernacchii]|uniref:transcription termination factor 4, mitochondrial n=1 Tax=Trematomus bernacchii TaxID=40690 RepID=UPI00146BCBC0|nr:transcription termination factor 4, mitochondrial [Trematomus bernacchii]
MGTRVAASQVLRWTLRNATHSVFGPLQFGRCQLQPLCAGGRLLCSSTSQGTVQSPQHTHEPHPLSRQPVTELSLPSLVDMGFTDSQAEHIYDATSKLRGTSASKHSLSTLTVMFVLGLKPSSVLTILEKCPELYTINELHLHQRIGNMRKLGLVEGSLQRVVSHFPQILTVPVKTVKHMVLFLKEKCQFTSQQVTDILRDSPAVILEDKEQLEYKFQYVYYRMGVKQADMVKSRLFRYTLEEVRCRHCFLERRGLYQTPDKKGQTIIINSKLDSILKSDLDTFLTDVAKGSAEEYEVFQRLMAREWQEEEEEQQLHGSIEADSDDDDEEEEEDEEDEESGKSAYRKRRKR